MSISVRVLDSTSGRPASGLAISLHTPEHGDGPSLARVRTDDAGRVDPLGPALLPRGAYRLVFATGEYFRELGFETHYTEVILSVHYPGDAVDLHIPLFLSPFSYSTHRGSR